MKRGPITPQQSKLVYDLAAWLMIRRRTYLDAILADAESELDRLTGGKFLRDKITRVATERALDELTKSIFNESLVGMPPDYTDKSIDAILKELEVLK